MSPTTSIDAQTAFARVSDGTALLICAYDNDDKFRRMHLQGAVPLSEFQAMASTLARDRELIFY